MHMKTTAWPPVSLLDMNEKQGVGTWISICLEKKGIPEQILKSMTHSALFSHLQARYKLI